ncbi:hypothetical protein [Streptomyces nigrescens]
MSEATLAVDDYHLIAPITLPGDGRAPGDVKALSDSDEYDAYFRIEHQSDISPDTWMKTVLSVAEQVSDDLPATSLEESEQAQILDGLAIILQHTLRQLAT